MFKFTTPLLVQFFFPQLIWKIKNKKQNIFLTFDDGPIPGPTEDILQILNKHQVKATFFCVGDNVKKHPDIFQKIINEGHQVGNHTFHHLSGWKTDLATYLQDVEACGKIMQNHSGKKINLFRPPYGKISINQIKKLKDYKIVMWNVLSRDFDDNYSSPTILNKIKNNTKRGSIVVFHDSLKTIEKVKKILPDYIEFCKQQNLEFSQL